MANANRFIFPRLKGAHAIVATVMTSALLATGLTMASSGAAQAGATVEEGSATADTYTVSTRSTFGNGTNKKIAIGDNTGATRTAFLRFNTNKQVAKSTEVVLNLNVTGGTAGKLRILQGPSEWSENGLTAANAPKLGTLVGTVDVRGGAHTMNVKLSGLQSASNGLNIVLERTDGGITRIDSREVGGAKAPSVNINSAAVRPPTGSDGSAKPPVSSENCSVSAILVPSCGLWFGAAANPLKGESWDQALLNFEKTSGRPMDIAHYYKRGQSAMFPNAAELKRQDQKDASRILFYNWKPTGMTWKQVADGKADAYLISLAKHMNKNASKKFFLSLNAEMEDEVNQNAGSGQTATDYANFFRHVVTVLRANGADNMVTVMNYTGIQKWGEMSWFEDLYPGNDVVDWIAQDPYAFGKPPVWLTDMEGMVNRTSNAKTWPGFYNWASKKYPSKPQMLAEWGVDEDGAYPNYKADFWKTANAQLKNLPKIKALVYWDSMGYTPSGSKLHVGVTQVDSKQSSINAYRNFLNEEYVNVARKSYLEKK